MQYLRESEMKQLIAILFTVVYFIFITPVTWSSENEQMIRSSLSEPFSAGHGDESTDRADLSNSGVSLQTINHHITPGKSVKAPRISCLTAAFHKYLSHTPVIKNNYRPYTWDLPVQPTVSVEVLRI